MFVYLNLGNCVTRRRGAVLSNMQSCVCHINTLRDTGKTSLSKLVTHCTRPCEPVLLSFTQVAKKYVRRQLLQNI